MRNHNFKTALAVLALAATLAPIGMAGAVTPSSNDANRDQGWAHFNVIDVGVGYATVDFVSTRGFVSCFEYRSDGAPTTDPRANFNPGITDGLWPFVCVNNSTARRTLEASQYVEIRMVFGAERDERFDWTRVEVDAVTYSCAGFKAPADREVVVRKPNRVLPLRMTLLDDYGDIVYGIAPPVVSVSYRASSDADAEILPELDYAGRGDDGNQFMLIGSEWVFNLSTRGLAAGEYTISAVPGGGYAFSESCEVVVTVQ